LGLNRLTPDGFAAGDVGLKPGVAGEYIGDAGEKLGEVALYAGDVEPAPGDIYEGDAGDQAGLAPGDAAYEEPRRKDGEVGPHAGEAGEVPLGEVGLVPAWNGLVGW